MAILAIKGHQTRGNEVIEILEMLGGKNTTDLNGEYHNMIYIINSSYYGEITYIPYRTDAYTVFTLEEFLEKFPYKIGDKILYKTYGIYAKIKTMLWNVEKEQVFYRLGLGSNKLFVATADELKLCKEETIEADEHPNKDLKRLIRKAKSYDKVVSKGLVSIERVCEWLSDNMKNYAAFDSDMIKDLKKAMEE